MKSDKKYKKEELLDLKLLVNSNTKKMSLNNPEHVRELTNNVCWRPDVFYSGGKTCDLCELFDNCCALGTKKRSKGYKSL